MYSISAVRLENQWPQKRSPAVQSPLALVSIGAQKRSEEVVEERDEAAQLCTAETTLVGRKIRVSFWTKLRERMKEVALDRDSHNSYAMVEDCIPSFPPTTTTSNFANRNDIREKTR